MEIPKSKGKSKCSYSFIVTNDSKARNPQTHIDGGEFSSSLQNILLNSLHFHTPSHARQLNKNHGFQQKSCTETHAQFFCKNTSFYIKLKNHEKQTNKGKKKQPTNQNKLQMEKGHRIPCVIVK